MPVGVVVEVDQGPAELLLVDADGEVSRRPPIRTGDAEHRRVAVALLEGDADQLGGVDLGEDLGAHAGVEAAELEEVLQGLLEPVQLDRDEVERPLGTRGHLVAAAAR